MALPQLSKQIFFFSYFGNSVAAIAKTIFFFFFFTFLAMPLPQLICHKFFELIIINHVWFIVKILCMWQLFFYSFTDFIIFFFHFQQWDCHNCQNNFFFFTLSAMALPQLPKQIFFFFPFSAMTLPQLLFFNWPDRILGRGISVTVLPKFLCFLSPPFSFSLSSFSLNFGNTVAEILSLSSFCQLVWNSAYKTKYH